MNPLAELRTDRARARELRDPCAGLCTVASVDGDGRPQARTLVLRDVGERLALFGNATSPKWAALAGASPLAVVIWLPTLNLQYRLSCFTEPVEAPVVHDSWQLRPAGPKRMDWFYTSHQPQSSRIESRTALLERLAALALPEPLVAPHTAQGVYLLPDAIDRLDLDQPDNVHDRRHYQRTADGWEMSILVP